jgi:hypothetical protein
MAASVAPTPDRVGEDVENFISALSEMIRLRGAATCAAYLQKAADHLEQKAPALDELARSPLFNRH